MNTVFKFKANKSGLLLYYNHVTIQVERRLHHSVSTCVFIIYIVPNSVYKEYVLGGIIFLGNSSKSSKNFSLWIIYYGKGSSIWCK